MASDIGTGHSEEYLGDYRNFWWNTDFVELLARRWRLSTASTLLDVGCGLCHWSLLLAPHLGGDREITAMDSDLKWAAGNDELKDRFAAVGSAVTFKNGSAAQIPFADDTFDVVTCQTVLIHTAEPDVVLREMKRVVKPGGIVICAEPNNLAGTASMDSLDLAADVRAATDKFRERLIYERGRAATGKGYISLGDQLPNLFRSAGFEDLRCYISDRINPLYPPYDDPAQKADIEQARKTTAPAKRNHEILKYAEALGSPEDLEFIHARMENHDGDDDFLRAIDGGTFFSGGLSVMYVVSGRK